MGRKNYHTRIQKGGEGGMKEKKTQSDDVYTTPLYDDWNAHIIVWNGTGELLCLLGILLDCMQRRYGSYVTIKPHG